MLGFLWLLWALLLIHVIVIALSLEGCSICYSVKKKKKTGLHKRRCSFGSLLAWEVSRSQVAMALLTWWRSRSQLAISLIEPFFIPFLFLLSCCPLSSFLLQLLPLKVSTSAPLSVFYLFFFLSFLLIWFCCMNSGFWLYVIDLDLIEWISHIGFFHWIIWLVLSSGLVRFKSKSGNIGLCSVMVLAFCATGLDWSVNVNYAVLGERFLSFGLSSYIYLIIRIKEGLFIYLFWIL